ncbi:uncharacterized protein PG986_002338 [Apiospora aurea]|uniref:Uncharacterized protein n=1 Tax=Apiospora aurea TaxID=335848 RepID=A0ABR1QZB6_9PEZI
MSDIPPPSPPGAHQAPARHRRPPLQSPLCVAAGLATARYFFRVDFRSLRGRRVFAGSAFAYAVMTPFDVWYWRRARDAVADRNGWEMRQKRTGYPVPAPRGVRGADGEWTAETAAATPARSGGDDGIMGIGSRGGGSVPAGRFGGGGSDGAREQGGFAGGAGGEEELQDPWALPQSKKGGSSRWS